MNYNVDTYDGLVRSSSFLNRIKKRTELDTLGYLKLLQVISGNTLVESYSTQYDGATDNLLYRQRNNNPAESFGYDLLVRLDSVWVDNGVIMSMVYAANGNITQKSSIGTYKYKNERLGKPHAVYSIEDSQSPLKSSVLTTTFNDFGKIQHIAHDVTQQAMDFSYGPDQQRWSTVFTDATGATRTILYAGNYEKVTENGITREFYYLDGNMIVVKQNGVFTPYLAFKDNLGSFLSIWDAEGEKVFDADYDVWGKQTVALNTIGFHRGYTGHEMWNEFCIINMNGRLYDPVIARFLSPDNYVQAPDNSQNFNRYSYCLNNPLKYNDPSGEFWHLIIGAAIGGVSNWVMNGCKFNAKGLGYFGVGAAAGALSSGIGAGVSSSMAVGGGVSSGGFWAGFMGTKAATTAATSFVSGSAIGGASGFAGGFTSKFGNMLVDGHGLSSSFKSGIVSGGISSLIGGFTGGIFAGINACRDGRTFWSGSIVYSTEVNAGYPATSSIGSCECLDKCAESVTGQDMSEIRHDWEKSSIRTQYYEKFRDDPRFEGLFIGPSDPNKEMMADYYVWKKVALHEGLSYSGPIKGNAESVFLEMGSGNTVAIGYNNHSVVANKAVQYVKISPSGHLSTSYKIWVMDPGRSAQYYKFSNKFFTNARLNILHNQSKLLCL